MSIRMRNRFPAKKRLEVTTAAERVFDTANVFLMICLSVCTLYPLLYVLFASLSEPNLLMKRSGLLFSPVGFNWNAYRAVLHNPNILTGYGNTLFYVVVGTAINLLLTSFGAYGLSRRNVMWSSTVMVMIVITMFFQGGLIPNYLLIQKMGMMDTRWAIIIPSAISAWNLIVMRTAFQSIPESLEESARMDGANDFTILFRIVLPLSLPVMAVMILLYGVGHWNAYFSAMIYLRNRELFPLQLLLREILITNNTENMMTGARMADKNAVGETIKYATIIIATIPVLVLYPFLQKYFVKGVLIGAVKE